ncbi:MAG: helix-hairpin-helix domain-containing protein, partial [Bacteroidales bacterium]|nr:helix-hairpin-helix domain-containing protein [Bacteroidales bacterium]
MSFKIVLLSSFLLVFSASFLYAQEETISSLDEIIEEIASSSDVELDYTTLFQSLETLYYDPIDLNTATEEELSDLIFLTEFQIFSLVNYRKKFGNYSTLYELQFVDGIDPITLKRLLPFVIVSDGETKSKTDFQKIFTYGRHNTMLRYQRLLQEKAGYIPISDSILLIDPDKSRYLGSPDKIYLRHSYNYKDKLYYGITAEKDDGEQFFKGAQKYGFDFYSGHFQINNIGIVKKLVVGDYIAQFGQGLTLWSGMSYGKTSSATNIIKKARGVNKYSSVNESAFFRGEAISLQYKNLIFTEFVSYKPLDGSVDTTYDIEYDTEEQYVTSFLETGYHRTPSEIAKRNSINEFVTGANLTWYTPKLRLGATGVYYNFSEPVGDNSAPYRFFDMVGNSNMNFGIDYLLSIHKISFFGETSVSQNLGYATVNGAVIDFVPEFKMSLVHRYFRPDYQARFAQPFSEGNKPYNESGLFIGAEIYPKKHWKIETYFDSWQYHWLRYGVGGP